MDVWPAILSVWAWGLTGFVILWPISLARRDSSVVDFWWGPGFGAMAVAAWLMAGAPVAGHAPLMAGLLLLWALRLGVQLGLRRLREGSEDPRYAALRAAWNPGFWWKSLFVVFLLQGILQALIAAGPIAAIWADPSAPGTLAWVGAGAMLAGLAVETVSDTQLDLWRRRHGRHGLMTTGLRSVMRYPSYAGEILVWVGLSAIGLSAGVWWAPVSALIVALLLWKVSGVPVLDQHMAETRPAFGRYAETVPALVPRLRPAGGLDRAERGG